MIVSSRWALQRDENGQPAAVLQINTDITERKRAAENLGPCRINWRTCLA